MMSDPRWGEALVRLPDYLGSHLRVSAAALALGLLVSFPLALAVRHRPALRGIMLGIASIVQTVPGLALLALFYPLLLILSAALASGFWGIENKVEPEPMVEGNAYDRKFPSRLQLPRTLWESAQRLKASRAARDWFGDAFVEHFAATREWEEREFRRAITDWELKRYFEII